ncbi:MAG: hypothetical protein AABY13_05150 [Nanoarchaeota archaeon]
MKPCSAYKDLPGPTILAAGDLGIYFVNMEKLLEDGGAWEKFGDDSRLMIMHACQQYEQVPGFRQVIGVMADQMRYHLTRAVQGERKAVSGGARRDWLFSGPIAHVLNLPHISCYKQEPGKPDRMEFVHPDMSVDVVDTLSGVYVGHAVDMTTEGSSILRTDKDGTLKGWAAMIRNKGGRINDVVAAATRLQGAEQRLAPYGLHIDALVKIDEEFLRNHSANPEAAVEYFKNPTAFSRNYLKENGALAFVKDFDPAGKRVDKAREFMKKYGRFLVEIDKFDELATTVQLTYGKPVHEIVGKDVVLHL